MLKESDLIEDHEYVSKNPKIIHGVLNKRKIIKIDLVQEFVTYVELKALTEGIGIKGILKTVSVKSFLRWAKTDLTKEKEEINP